MPALSADRRDGRCAFWACNGMLLLAIAGCGQRPSAPNASPGAPNLDSRDAPGPPSGTGLTIPQFDTASFPQLGPPRRIESGVVVHETVLGTNKIWTYLPERKAEDGSLPCVLVAPAGTALINGMDLSDGDRPEQLPYARAGMVVVAYSLSGPVPIEAIKAALIRGAPDPQVIGGAQAFVRAGGLQ
jgi:hypothetical protein